MPRPGDRTFTFRADIKCALADGTTETLKSFKVPVEAATEQQAKDHLKSVAVEIIHDKGGDLLSAPMEDCEIVGSWLVKAH